MSAGLSSHREEPGPRDHTPRFPSCHAGKDTTPQFYSPADLIRTPYFLWKCDYCKSPHTRERRSSRTPVPCPERDPPHATLGHLTLTAFPEGTFLTFTLILDRSPGNRPRRGSAPLTPVHPRYPLGPGAVPADHVSQGSVLWGEKRMFSVPSQALERADFPPVGRRESCGPDLNSREIQEAQPCGLWPSLLGHAPVTTPRPPGTLPRRRLCREKEKAEAQRESERASTP